MRAAVYEQYGPPEVVKVKDINKPIPSNKDLLIKVVASTVNRTDAGFRSAEYFVSRFWSGLFKPKYQVLGSEFAGIVEDIGCDVTSFRVGDRVFGFDDNRFGGHAEYLVISEDAGVACIPDHTEFMEAAAITEGAHYALTNIKASKVKPGDKILVYGATGAIGSAAVQLLKFLDTHVTAVCNSRNIELVKSLGADHVIDYEKEDFTRTQSRYQFIFDAVGKSSFKACKPLLEPKGCYISTELGKGGANVFLALFTPLTGGKRVLFPIPSMTKQNAVFLADLVRDGKFRPVIDQYFNLDDIVKAYRYVETGQKTGNVILKIN